MPPPRPAVPYAAVPRLARAYAKGRIGSGPSLRASRGPARNEGRSRNEGLIALARAAGTKEVSPSMNCSRPIRGVLSEALAYRHANATGWRSCDGSARCTLRSNPEPSALSSRPGAVAGPDLSRSELGSCETGPAGEAYSVRMAAPDAPTPETWARRVCAPRLRMYRRWWICPESGDPPPRTCRSTADRLRYLPSPGRAGRALISQASEAAARPDAPVWARLARTAPA